MFITREKLDEIQKENEMLKQKVKGLEHQIKEISSHSSGNQTIPMDNHFDAASLNTTEDAFFFLENMIKEVAYPNSDTCLKAFNVYIQERFNGLFNDQWSFHISTLKQMVKSLNILSLFEYYLIINNRMLNTSEGAALTSLLEMIGVQQKFSLSEQLKQDRVAAKLIESELSQYGISKQWLIKNKLAFIPNKAVDPCNFIRLNGESTTALIKRIVKCSQNYEAALKGYQLSVPQNDQLLYNNTKAFSTALNERNLLPKDMTYDKLYDSIAKTIES